MRVVKPIPIANIIVDRHSLSPQTFSLAKHLESGGHIPAVRVVAGADGAYILRDGRHRVTATKLLGWTHIEARFWRPD